MTTFQFTTKKATTKKGFTLIETLFAIFIVSIALVAATAALQSSLQTSYFVKNQITARFLAEDAMEYILAERDAGVATPGGWMSNPNISQCITTDLGPVECEVDTYSFTTIVTKAPSPQVTTSPTPLYVCSVSGANNSSVFVYEQSDTTGCIESSFERTVTITPRTTGVNAYNEAVVTVKVTWGDHFSPNESYTLSADIYNWQPAS